MLSPRLGQTIARLGATVGRAILILVSVGSSSCFSDTNLPQPTLTKEITPSIQIIDNVSGCFGGAERGTTFRFEDDVWTNGGEVIEHVLVEKVVQALVESEGKEFDPMLVGLTPAEIKNQAERVISGMAARMGLKKIPNDLVSELFSEEEVLRLAKESFDKKIVSTNQSQLIFHFKLQKIDIVAEALGQHGWKMPWVIEVNGRSWRTFSPTVPLALREMLNSYRNEEHALSGDWLSYLLGNILMFDDKREQTQAAIAFEILKGVEGASAGMATFLPPKRALPHFFNDGHGLELWLPTREPEALFREVRWRNHSSHESLVANWRHLLRYYDQATKAVLRHPWIQDWLKLDDGSNLQLRILNRGVWGDVHRAAWREAGLEGQPEFAISLENQTGTAELLLGSASDESLIVRAHSLKTVGHWLAEVSFDRYHGDSILAVDRAGDRRTVR